MVKPFVITGTGRSGTMGTSYVLSCAGIRNTFELFFNSQVINLQYHVDYESWLRTTNMYGEVSSLAPPYLQYLPKTTAIIHQVRNPVAVITSCMGMAKTIGNNIRYWPNVKFNRLYMSVAPINESMLTFFMRYWLEWNKMIEPYACLRYRVEERLPDPECWNELLETIGAERTEQTDTAFRNYSTSYNAGSRDFINWPSIPNGVLKDRILQKAIEYGYTEADLVGYQVGRRILEPEDIPKGVALQMNLVRHLRATKEFIKGLVEFYKIANKPNGIGVEIGCCQGESAEIACQFLKHLYCVDPWDTGFETNEPYFNERMKAIANYTKVKMPSAIACDHFEDESIDLVYIDGMHDYVHIRQDLLCWMPKLKIGGILGGHDFDDMEEHEGIVRAVTELLGTPHYRFIDNSFMFIWTEELRNLVNARIDHVSL